MRDVWLFEGFGFTNDYSKHGFKLRQNYMYIQERGAEMNAKKTCELYGVIKTDFGFWKCLMQLSFYRSGSKFRYRNNKISVMFDKNVDVVVDEILCPFMKHYWGAIMGLLNRSFRHRSKKTSKFCVTGLCVWNSPETGEFPAQMVSNAENVSIWWRHHGWCYRGWVSSFDDMRKFQGRKK